MSKKGEAFLAELRALCERHQIEIRASRGPVILIDDVSTFSKRYGYVGSVTDNTIDDPVAEPESYEQSVEYRTDFPTEPIGGKNPYHRCKHCHRSVPEINGRVDGHLKNCGWRQLVELDSRKGKAE